MTGIVEEELARRYFRERGQRRTAALFGIVLPVRPVPKLEMRPQKPEALS